MAEVFNTDVAQSGQFEILIEILIHQIRSPKQ